MLSPNTSRHSQHFHFRLSFINKTLQNIEFAFYISCWSLLVFFTKGKKKYSIVRCPLRNAFCTQSKTCKVSNGMLQLDVLKFRREGSCLTQASWMRKQNAIFLWWWWWRGLVVHVVPHRFVVISNILWDLWQKKLCAEQPVRTDLIYSSTFKPFIHCDFF